MQEEVGVDIQDRDPPKSTPRSWGDAPPRRASPNLGRPPRTLHDKYLIGEELGRGAYGRVPQKPVQNEPFCCYFGFGFG